jgi:tetratricopeptide (TPR) repeat protein
VVHNNLGYIFLKMGQYERAAAEEQEAIRLLPDIGMAYNNLMDASNALDRLEV